jgi:hypothetical protein
MAETYLLSLIDAHIALARHVFDVVSAGVHPLAASQRHINPKKLERLFQNNNLLHCWPNKSERILVAEDLVEFQFIFLLDGADPEAPWTAWAHENRDEYENFKQRAVKEKEERDSNEAASHPASPTFNDDDAWKQFFQTRVIRLDDYFNDKKNGKSDGRSSPPALADPVQENSETLNTFGIRYREFEKTFLHVKSAIDEMLRQEFGFDVNDGRAGHVKDERIMKGVDVKGLKLTK